MITLDALHFYQALPEGRLLALDIGKRYVGIALSDANRIIASPHRTYEIQNKAKTQHYFRTLLAEYHPAGLVTGWPLTLQGEEGASTKLVMEFLTLLAPSIFPGPILLYDERFSTRAVTRAMQEDGMKRKDRTARDNHLAAAYILQGALERLRGIGS